MKRVPPKCNNFGVFFAKNTDISGVFTMIDTEVWWFGVLIGEAIGNAALKMIAHQSVAIHDLVPVAF